MGEVKAIHLSGTWTAGWLGKGREEGRKRMAGTVQSVFEQAVNYVFFVGGEERLVTILREEKPLLPDSMVVSEDLFLQIRKKRTMELCGGGGRVLFDEMDVGIKDTAYVELFLPASLKNVFRKEGMQEILKKRLDVLRSFQESYGKKSDIERLPARYQEFARRMISGYLACDAAVIVKAYGEMAGAGRGLTPACDDVMVGIMAAACAWLEARREDGGNMFRKLCGRMRGSLVLGSNTTKISCKYLKCACEGYFSRLLCEWMAWCFEKEGDGEKDAGWMLLMQIADMGHTSGMDTIYGISKMLEGICVGK